jgi:tRNA(Ile)-lysidine synthase
MSTSEPVNCGLESGKLILVAVSGGADSLALLHFLHEQGYPLLVAAFNHQLREGAAAEVDFVRKVAEGLGVPFVSGSGKVAEHAEEQGLSLEEAARELRYRFLFDEARKAGAQAVATGHTADDQAETVLMHFVRGAGLSGLKGMPARVILPSFDPDIPIVRPLLGWTRAETEARCREAQLQPRNDPTNADTLYFRNRLRHELLPILEQYNPHIRQALAKTALALQGDYELLNELTQSAWQSALSAEGAGYIGFDLGKLQAMSPALRRNLFRKAAFQLCPGERDIDFEALKRAAGLKPADLAGGLKTTVEPGRIYLLKENAALPSESWPQVEGRIVLTPGRFALGAGWMLVCEETDGENLQAEARANTDPLTAWLAAGPGVSIRAARSGDRFEPLGMARQTIKLADLFVNLKILKRLRPRWPVVCVGEEIAWVVGLRLAEGFKIRAETNRAIKISIQKA